MIWFVYLVGILCAGCLEVVQRLLVLLHLVSDPIHPIKRA
jgi:hypothetical protein